jgi:hypothetical protein
VRRCDNGDQFPRGLRRAAPAKQHPPAANP